MVATTATIIVYRGLLQTEGDGQATCLRALPPHTGMIPDGVLWLQDQLCHDAIRYGHHVGIRYYTADADLDDMPGTFQRHMGGCDADLDDVPDTFRQHTAGCSGPGFDIRRTDVPAELAVDGQMRWRGWNLLVALERDAGRHCWLEVTYRRAPLVTDTPPPARLAGPVVTAADPAAAPAPAAGCAGSFRVAVYGAVDAERAYQQRRWGLRQADDMFRDAAHSVGSYLTLLRHHLTRTEADLATSPHPDGALEGVRKLAALAVACLEQHGVRYRDPSVLVRNARDGRPA